MWKQYNNNNDNDEYDDDDDNNNNNNNNKWIIINVDAAGIFSNYWTICFLNFFDFY